MIGSGIKNRLLFYSSVLLFILSRIPYLHYAFFWDESWVYAPAAFLMYDHGPSLLPDAIPVLFSRGHPLLFPALCAGWMKIFGRSNYSMHCFALLISVALAIILYEVLLSVFNKRIALLSAALLLLNTYFIVESTVAVNDIIITLFAFLSLFFYAKEKYILTAVTLSLLVFTKESGLVAVGVIIADMFFLAIKKKMTVKIAFIKFAAVLFPLILLSLFFIIQKKEFGWYMYPGHTSKVILNIDNTLYNLQRSMHMLFVDEKVFYFYLPLLFLSGYAVWKYKRIKYLWTFITALIIYCLIYIFSFKAAVFYFSVFGFIGLLGYILLIPSKIFNVAQGRFLQIMVLFLVFYLYFCCINFFEGRYLFPCYFIITFILIPVLYNCLIPNTKNYWNAGVLILIMITGVLINIYPDKDRKVGNFDRMDVQQEVVNYLEQNNYYDSNIASSAFLEQVHLKDPNTGFLKSQRSFSNIKHKIDSATNLVIFDDIEYDNSYEAFKLNPAFVRIHRYEKGVAWVEVYARK